MNHQNKIISIHEYPEYGNVAAKWFHEKWKVPLQAYNDSIAQAIRHSSPVPAWYLCLDGNTIVGGLGVIENDFHNRPDLTPNVCAVYTEEPYRNRGIAGEMLAFACADMEKQGIDTLYLLTDHTSFYERYGWEYFCPVLSDGETEQSRMYVHKKQSPVIETQRLFLREMTQYDFEDLYAVLGDSDIMRHYPYTFDAKRVHAWIDKNRVRYRTFGFGLWAMCLQENGKMIGDCGLTMQNINGVICPEIGYHIRKEYQRNGYATEAAVAVRDWIFTNTPFRRIFSYMKADNIASVKTAMAYGCRKTDEFTDSEGEQTVVYVVDRE